MQKLLSSRGAIKKVAYVVGDNLLPDLESLQIQPLTRATGPFDSWRRKYPDIVLANAYIGCWGIVQALNDGADIVICGRCTDASTVSLPFVHKHQLKGVSVDSGFTGDGSRSMVAFLDRARRSSTGWFSRRRPSYRVWLLCCE